MEHLTGTRIRREATPATVNLRRCKLVVIKGAQRGTEFVISGDSLRVGKAPDANDLAYLPTAGPGVRALLAADPTFDVSRFLDGAQSAYRMILESFWKGELDKVRSHVDDHVFDAFQSSVDQRNSEGLFLDNRLVHIDQALISAASLEQTVAFVTVRFEADIAAVTRNKEGEAVAGSMSDAVQTRDLWTFRRDVASRDPNWLLVETDEEE